MAATTVAGSAAAQPADKGGDEAAYKQHMQNGVKLYQDRNLEAAIAEFQAAYRVKPKASPLLNIALCRKGLFDYPRAIASLETALSKHPDTLTAADKKNAEDAIAEMKSLLAYVTVEVTPAAATLSVDGVDLAKAAATQPVPLGPGTHQIGARADGYASATSSVTVSSGEKGKKVSLALLPDKGWVTIYATDRKTAIAVDQKPLGYGTWAGFLAPGNHFVQMYKPGAAPYEQSITVAAGKAQDVRQGLGGPVPRNGEGPDPPEEPPAPPVRGFYSFLTGTVYGVSTDPSQLDTASNDPGVAGGVRIGYRVATILGLEGLFQYGRAGGDGIVFLPEREADGSFDTESLRIGANLRLMTKGKTVRFVGTMGGGLAYDSLTFSEGLLSLGEPDGAVSAYLLLEPAIEVQIGHLILGAALPIMPTSSGGGDTDASSDPSGTSSDSFGSALAQVGFQLRVGYGSW
ncbi:MAG: tetratricopeptide repeat protein [Polyangiaceae bacterium]